MSAAAIAAASAQDGTTDPTSAPWNDVLQRRSLFFLAKQSRFSAVLARTRQRLADLHAVRAGDRRSTERRLEGELTRPRWLRACAAVDGGTSRRGEYQTDTVASGTITYLGLTGLQPFASLNLNLPTGRAALFGSSANARMDGDLVEIGSFGEGLNVGPTVGFNLPVNNTLMLTGSVGYTRRGSFERENDPILTTTTNLRPGEASRSPDRSHTKQISLQSRSPGRSRRRQRRNRTASKSCAPASGSVRRRLRLCMARGLGTNDTQHFARTQRTQQGAFAGYVGARHRGFQCQFQPFSHRHRARVRGRTSPIRPDRHLPLPQQERLRLDHATIRPGEGTLGGRRDRAVRNQRNRLVEHAARAVWIREGDRPAPDGVLFSVLLNDFVAAVPVPVISGTGWQASVGLNVRS